MKQSQIGAVADFLKRMIVEGLQPPDKFHQHPDFKRLQRAFTDEMHSPEM
jgi:hypothetical protein